MDDDKILAALPAAARAKLEALERARRSAHAAVLSIRDDADEVREDLRHRETIHRQHVLAGRARRDDEPTEIVALRERLRKLSAEAEVASAALQVAAAPVGAARRWAVNVIGAGSRIVAVPAPTVRVKGDLAAEVETTRKRLAEIDREIVTAEGAPVPRDELKRRALDALDELAGRGTPSIAVAQRLGDPVGIEQAFRLMVVSDERGLGRVTDAGAAFIAWALRDLVAEKIGKLIDTAPIKGALDDDTRDQRLRELAAQRLDAERREEALIETATKAGAAVARRPDADPRAVLGVADQ